MCLKKTFLLLLLLAFSLAVSAQGPLTKSRTGSVYTYLYKVSDKDMLMLYQNPEKLYGDVLMTNPVDSFKTGTYFNEHLLPAGNYLQVYVKENFMNYKLIERRSATLQILSSDKKFDFIVTDPSGNIVTNAAITANGKIIGFNDRSAIYSFSPSKNNIVVVKHNGVSNFFMVNRQQRYRPFPLSPKWFKSKWYWVKRQFKSNEQQRRYYYDRYGADENYTGFMVFNKPKYKPRDTVHFKAFIVNRKSHKPVAGTKLLVRLAEDNADDDFKTIGTVTSYAPGLFEYSFVLNDSLDIDLDDTYKIYLTDPVKLYKPKHKNDDDDDEPVEESDKKYKAYIAGTFEYEEYELKSLTFNMRTDVTEHSPGVPLNAYFKATDENGLPVPDGRIKLLLTTNSISQYKGDRVFVPDTLWKHDMKLEQLGETKVVIPDSIFPKADINYRLQADLYNSSNEHRNESKWITYKYENNIIKADLAKDSLVISAITKGKPTPFKAWVSAINSTGDTVSKQQISLPAGIRFSPNAARYLIQTDSARKYVELHNFTGNLSIRGQRTADTVHIVVDNPRKLHFWYGIFSGTKLVDQGEADSLNYKKRIKYKAHTTIFYSYLWGGNIVSENKVIPYFDKELNISVKQPLSAYPGQKINTQIEVKDAKGRPVPGTDITAWALTSKFEGYSSPFVPNLSGTFKYKTKNRRYDGTRLHENWTLKLNWARWGRQLGLDSMMYYNFTHPKEVFMIEEPTPDSTTQVAPFVVKNGDIVPVHVVYIDHVPVYFSQAQQLQRYSFRADSGLHTIQLRTASQTLTLENVLLCKNQKLILSINADTALNKKAFIIPAADTLTNHEAHSLNNYFIKVSNTFQHKLSFIEQGNRLYDLSFGYNNYGVNELLVGPISSNYSVLNIAGDSPLAFLSESGYTYTFTPGLMKQKSISTPLAFNKRLAMGQPTNRYDQYALSKKEHARLWQQYLDRRSQTTPLFKIPDMVSGSRGALNFSIKDNFLKEGLFIKNVLLYKNDSPDFVRIYQGSATYLGYLEAGKYRLFLLLNDNTYHIEENIIVKAFGKNYYEIALKPKPQDEVSQKINEVITGRLGNSYNDDHDTQLLKQTFNKQYVDRSTFTATITGTVVDEEGKALPGVTINIKGTGEGTMTNAQGRFSLGVPPQGNISINYIGYISEEFIITPGQHYSIRLTASKLALQEVVVVGYGSQKKQSLTASVSVINELNINSALAGRVAGITASDVEMKIRGISSVQGKSPLVILDGVAVTEDMLKSIPPSEIGDLSILRDQAATAIYGARASNGVIIVNTKAKQLANQAQASNQQQGEDNIRKNFADHAYWFPRLITDEQGKASFITTLPDDITQWRTFVIGANVKSGTGFTEGSIKSFKPLSASFISPAFAVRGDKLSAIGKVMNYAAEPAKIKRSFNFNGNPVKQDSLIITNSYIDTLNVTATGADSLTFAYFINRPAGYFDGEQRKIPVIEKGIIETKGIFDVLKGDTSVSYKFNQLPGEVTLRAEATMLPTLVEETQKLRDYKYLCNEQLASKLKGLLVEKRIKAYQGQPFKHGDNVQEIIKKIMEGRKQSGMWGWWKDSPEELWISLHVTGALIDAEKEGYRPNLDKKRLTAYLVNQLESYNGSSKLTCLELLHKMAAQVDYKRYLKAIQTEMAASKATTQYDRLRLMLLQLQTGEQIDVSGLLKTKRKTMFGNTYWGEQGYSFFDNSIQLSLLAYRIFKAEDKHPEIPEQIIGYLLEQRREGGWRNTYESSLILETLLPDLLGDGKQLQPPVLTLSGALNATVSDFPYTAKFSANSLNISKKGTLPVYITGYQQFFNPAPKKVSKDFTVNTWFERAGKRLQRLTGGEAVTLKAEVTARADGEYVMVEIPIPAGCSYDSKAQSWSNNEVHREHFKEKVSIFCRKLKQGTYTFEVKLMPRYDGEYTLNPAKAELMYFPVFYGREGLKQVTIGN